MDDLKLFGWESTCSTKCIFEPAKFKEVGVGKPRAPHPVYETMLTGVCVCAYLN